MKIPRSKQNKYGCRYCAHVKGKTYESFECDYIVCPYTEELDKYKNYEQYEHLTQKTLCIESIFYTSYPIAHRRVKYRINKTYD